MPATIRRHAFRMFALMMTFFVVSSACAYDLRSDEGNLKAVFKAEPKFSKIKGVYHADKSETTMYQWQLDEGDTETWLVSYVDYRSGLITQVGLGKFYEGAVTGALQATKGTQIGSTQTVVNSDLSGREFFYKVDPFEVRHQVFVKGDRMYQILHVGAPGASKSAEVQKFVDSLSIGR
jgi:hypothetical protein